VPAGHARGAIELKVFETRYLIAVRDAEEVVRNYRRTLGELPAQPAEVAAAGLELPPDPLGGVWEWADEPDAEPGEVRSSIYYEVFAKLSADSGLGGLGVSASSGGPVGPARTPPADRDEHNAGHE
jgi:hypothetical protein